MLSLSRQRQNYVDMMSINYIDVDTINALKVD